MNIVKKNMISIPRKLNSLISFLNVVKKRVSPDNAIIESHVQKKKQALEKNLLIISEEDKISVHPKTKKDCPKCGNKEAETWQNK